MKSYDYLIVGDGLAGTTLIWHLLPYNKKILWLCDVSKPAASRVAAGIYNPLTGKKLVKTWMADKIFPYAGRFYSRAEELVKERFWHSLNILRPFRNTEEQNTYMALAAEPALTDYIEGISDCAGYQEVLKAKQGALEVKNAGWLDVNRFLDTSAAYFADQVTRIEGEFKDEDLKPGPENVGWKDYQVSRIILCTGDDERQRSWFGWLPFNPVKGQLLEVEMETFPASHIVNQGAFILPVKGSGFKIGATYSWHDIDWETSEDGRQFLQHKVSEFLTAPYRITGQSAGIRPCSKDRRPLIGLHPEFERIGIFNGLGTKGVTLGPYFAEEFAGFLENSKDLSPDVNIDRYFSLYYDHKKSD